MPRALPDDLPTAFSTRDAREAGVTRSRLRAADLERPVRGGYLAGEPDVALDDRALVLRKARAAAAALGGNAFVCHVTAAVAWEVPLPFRVTPERALDFGVVHPRRPPRLHGVHGHRVQPGHVRVWRHASLAVPIASPASTWAMLGTVLTDPYDLIAAAEALISDTIHGRDGPLATLEQLEAAVFAGRRVGINALRRALPRIRPRVASRTETWTRLVLIDGGLPEPEVNYLVRDADGRLLACVDLAYPHLRVAIEYEGEHHLFDRAQWTKDIARYEALAAAGWTVIRVTRTDLFEHPAELVSRVRSACARAARAVPVSLAHSVQPDRGARATPERFRRSDAV